MSRPLAPALFLLLSACEGAVLSTVVGPEGLDVAFPGGGRLEIPPGALAEEVDIGVELITDVAAAGWRPLMDGFGDPGFAVALTPHGLRFTEPVRLSLPAPEHVDGLVVLRASDPYSPSWVSAGRVTWEDGVASVEIRGFSGYAVTTVEDGACPCFDAADVHAEGTTAYAPPPYVDDRVQGQLSVYEIEAIGERYDATRTQLIADPGPETEFEVFADPEQELGFYPPPDLEAFCEVRAPEEGALPGLESTRQTGPLRAAPSRTPA